MSGCAVSRRLLGVLALVSVLAGATAAFSVSSAAFGAAVLPAVNGAASADRPATSVFQPGDLVSVYERSQLSDATSTAAAAAAASAGAATTITRGFQIGMTSVRRGSVAIQTASGPGTGTWQFPMSVSAMPLVAIGGVFGRAVSAPISAGAVVMGSTTAALRGAMVGDTITLVAASGAQLAFTIGMVADDSLIGGTEILMSTDQADALGATIPTSVLVYGRFDRQVLDAALGSRGLPSGIVRVRRSWDPQDPDSTLGLAQTKRLLGEFAFAVSSSGAVAVDPVWQAAYIRPRETYPLGIRASCNQAVHADLQAALTDIYNAGLGGAIDVANTNSAGGCFGPRFNRISANLGVLSRHSWGQPIDLNTVQNCQGCVPKLDCRVVVIFRRHGFAWGGNFLLPDGMHFEWTGRATDTLQYPSRDCPNPPPPAGTQALPSDQQPAASTRTTFFADQPWAV
ncbi:MAG: M15 family metallopeptidase, partial [Ilumatobacteraceae bacterium]